MRIFIDLEKTVNKIIIAHQDQIENVGSMNPFDGAQQLQIHGNLDDLKLEEHESRLRSMESLQHDVEGIHSLHNQLREMVREQGEQVENIEENVSVTQENVHSGFKQLVKAHK